MPRPLLFYCFQYKFCRPKSERVFSRKNNDTVCNGDNLSTIAPRASAPCWYTVLTVG